MRQERMWQPRVAPRCPQKRHLIMRPRRTARPTCSSLPSDDSYTCNHKHSICIYDLR